MPTQPLTPTRKKQLNAYIAGCKRAERRIIIGYRNRLGAGLDISRFRRQKPLIEHITASAIGERAQMFTTSLVLLRVARGKFKAELEGLPWHA